MGWGGGRLDRVSVSVLYTDSLGAQSGREAYYVYRLGWGWQFRKWGPLQGRTQDFRRGGGRARVGGGVPRSPKEANQPNKHATGLKPRTCAHQGQCLGPSSVCFVESSIFTALV